jgi:hypothetical protein
VRYRNAILEIRVDDKKAELKVISGPAVEVKVYGQKYILDQNGMTVLMELAAS